ncbi:terminase TerL endonuclease subunit [Pisciglobus halotolerans]|uniref:Phage terminase-like protein, large subunit, contains N-terminal HTH domain n=1 Tax=Pisciglobus halotolerans TaxID=745365 RepID=A0A1I3C2B2_9LACT|nr:terminase TerL endonuclease subunit [Pisciglobus halotolerans]SFH68697.1 Phage terminase-like protein, large subunit, contains N-terminal HTH domain [Pisciglobus halotolerans]
MYSGGCRHLDDWIDIVDTGKQKTNKEMKLLIRLVKQKLNLPNTYVDQLKVKNCIELIEKYRPYKLAPIQRFIHACISGLFYDNGDLVFEEFFLYIARGFGKNAILTDAAFYLTSNRHGVNRYNFDIVANSEDQAKTSFMDVHETIGNNKNLIPAYDRSLVRITFKKTNSTIRYYTSNAATKDGLRPGAVGFDETHQYENYDQLKVFTSALGKVPFARIFYTTTDGYVRGAVLDDQKTEALEVLQGMDTESTLFPMMCRIDSYEEWEDPDSWEKANPMLPYLPELKKAYMRDYKKAKKNPAMKIEFLTKRLNWPLEDTSASVASWDDILATNQEIPKLDGMQCVGAVDYADIRDFIGVGLLFKKDGKRYWRHHTFVVAESLKLTKFKLDIDRAVNEGLVTIVPGTIMDPAYITNWFIEQVNKHGYRIKNIAMDRFRISVLKEAFQEAGLPWQEVPSGPITHGKLAPLIDTMFANHTIVYGNDMMMRWYTNNVYVKMDNKGNKTYEKIEPETRKTDGFMALVHALSLDEQLEVRTVKYNKKLKTYNY